VAESAAFDPALQSLLRLRLCAVLRPVAHMEFGAIRESLGASDGTLSKTIAKLAELGYLAVSKGTSDARGDLRRTTSVRLTPLGARAFDRHIEAMRQLVVADPP
jgi:DNA-binding MarR family transcriptional regulator